MTRLLFLPGPEQMFLLDIPTPPEDLIQAVNHNGRSLPPPLDSLLAQLAPQAVGGNLSAFRLNTLVVISASCDEANLLTASAAATPIHLSPRQKQVLELLIAGCTLKAIAYRLDIKASTVRMHLTGIKEKLGTQTLAQTVGRAVALGLCRVRSGGG